MPLQYINVTDQRTDNDIDEIFEKPTIEEVNKVVQLELKNSGMFSQIILSQETSRNAKSALGSNETPLIFKGMLKDLKWEILNDEEMRAVAFPDNTLTGRLGGLVFGSTDVFVYGQALMNVPFESSTTRKVVIDKDVDVYGHAVMDIRIENSTTGKVLIDKEYVAHVKETMIKLGSDSPKTKAEMVGKVLGALMKQFKADLQKKLSN